MPITTIGSYPPTMQEFINHWTQVNASLGAAPLTLRGGYTLANFTAERNAIIISLNAVIAADNTAQTTASALAIQRAAITPRAIQFRKWVQGYLVGTVYPAALPVAPRPDAVESKFLDPLQDIFNLWTTINADASLTGVPLPLTLTGGYVVATFTTELTTLRTAFLNAKNAAEQATFVRKQRDLLLPPAEQRIKQYRTIIQARFAGTAFENSLPALSPPPGATPDPVMLTGAWDTALGKAVFNWTASANATLASYSLRACTGSTYRAVDEFVVADLPAGTTTFQTLSGLPLPGNRAVYRVYVVLTTGNERGSNNAAILRPV